MKERESNRRIRCPRIRDWRGMAAGEWERGEDMEGCEKVCVCVCVCVWDVGGIYQA